MTSARSKSIITIFVLLSLMALLSITSMLTSQIRLPNNRPQTGQPFNGNFQGNDGNGAGNFQNFPGTNRTRNNARVFSLFGIMRTLGLGGQAFLYINLGIPIIGVLLLLLSAYGVWRQKRWGLNLAMVLAIFVLIGAVPGLFTLGGRFINYWRIAQNVVNTGAAVVILFLGILPSVRDSVA